MTTLTPKPLALPRLVAHEQGDYGIIYCPACLRAHAIYLGQTPPEDGKPIPYNGRPTAPTFVGKLSILARSQYLSQPYIDQQRCTFTVTGGQVAFDKSCGHALAGKTVPLPAWPSGIWPGDKVPEYSINRVKMP